MNLDEAIQHAGVKGMKWGKRKGPIKGKQTLSSRAKKNVNSIKRERQWTDQYKRRASMSDAQLRTKLNRLRLENEFARQAGEAKLSQRKRAKMFIDASSSIKNSSSGKALSAALAKKVAKKAAVAAVVA
ncbi:MAG: hypothetical protein RR643_05040 [Anaerorhabdus sp.]|uniref:DUF7211 domain-containing protein n=1 Tax=Anaerorhabdus sp. TaxID=1872524 RepID=UPI002FCA2EAD